MFEDCISIQHDNSFSKKELKWCFENVLQSVCLADSHKLRAGNIKMSIVCVVCNFATLDLTHEVERYPYINCCAHMFLREEEIALSVQLHIINRQLGNGEKKFDFLNMTSQVDGSQSNVRGPLRTAHGHAWDNTTRNLGQRESLYLVSYVNDVMI